MRLFAAIFAKLLKNSLIILLIMAILFVGYITAENLWPTVKSYFNNPENLQAVQHQLTDFQTQLDETDTRISQENRHVEQLRTQLTEQEAAIQAELDHKLAEITEVAALQKQRINNAITENQQRGAQAIAAIDQEYCRTYNPLKWLTCQAMRQQIQAFKNNMHSQRAALIQTAARVEENARQDAAKLHTAAQRQFADTATQFDQEIATTLQTLDALQTQRQQLASRFDELTSEQQRLQKQSWLILEIKQRWPKLLIAALLIFFAPYIRRTLWYFVGMPLVSRAKPIQLTDPTTPGTLHAAPGQRTISVDIAATKSLRARAGYIQSDQLGARTDLFFDWKSPNLSYLSGLVLLTRLDASTESTAPETTAISTENPTAPAPPEARKVMLGSPDDADAYLTELRLEDHPGVVLRARNIVAVVGDVRVQSRWRLTSWHAWATSQVRFLVFSGTGSVILEGYGDINAQPVDQNPTEKRMPLVVGFDTRLAYKTRRTATFLPYLISPNREPLVVDVFDGTGTFIYQKNPVSRAQSASATERVAGFFFDSIRNLLGI